MARGQRCFARDANLVRSLWRLWKNVPKPLSDRVLLIVYDGQTDCAAGNTCQAVRLSCPSTLGVSIAVLRETLLRASGPLSIQLQYTVDPACFHTARPRKP